MKAKNKTKSKTPILSLLLAAILLIWLLPVDVWAVETGSPDDLNLRSPIAVSGAASNYQHIYFGGWRWRILDKGHQELYMLSEGIVDNSVFRTSSGLVGTVPFTSNTYYLSNIWSLFNQSTNSFISAKEQPAVNRNGSNDKLYLLSVNEINSYDYFPGGNADRAATAAWWLRSSGTGLTDGSSVTGYASLVNSDGTVVINGATVGGTEGVRPAFRLNLSSVLFTADAANGTSAIVGSNLTKAAPLNSDMKLTLEDSSQTLTINTVTSDSRSSGSAVTVSYSGATTSASNYLCAELTTGGATWRGAIKSLAPGSESGTATFNLPEALTASYTFRIWNEQYNAANTTNYACKPVSRSITFANPSISNVLLPKGVVGTAYSGPALTALDGTGACSWNAAGLPEGLSLDAATGVISGTPAAGGSFNVAVTVTDGSSKTATASFNLTVYPLTNIQPHISIANGIAFSMTIYGANGALNGTAATPYGTITGTASGNDTVLTGTLTGVPNTWTEVSMGTGKIKIRAVTPPSTTLSNPSFY